MSHYLFDQGWELERGRLNALSGLYDVGTTTLLKRLGIGASSSCLEIGAGNGSVARWMSTQVGSQGRVVATDIDPRFIEALARDGVEVRRHDICTDALETAAFDIIHTRAVLQHVSDRVSALAHMSRALRPGGTLLIEDIIMPHPACYPELPAWEKVLNAMASGLVSAGADPYYGLKLMNAMGDIDLVNVQCEARVPMMFSGSPSIDFVVLSLEQVGGKLVDRGAVTGQELSETLDALRSPGRTLTAAIMIACWGFAR